MSFFKHILFIVFALCVGLTAYAQPPVLSNGPSSISANATSNCITDTIWLSDAYYCHPEEDPIFFDQTWPSSSSGVAYSEVYSNSEGCDSIVAQPYFRKLPQQSHEYLNFCEGDSFYFDSAWYAENENFNFEYQSQYGCDSLHTVHLNFNAPSNDSIHISLIGQDSAFVHGSWQSQTGWYSNTYTSSYGCDSSTHYYIDHQDNDQCSAPGPSSEWEFAMGSTITDKVVDTETDKCGNLFVLLEAQSTGGNEPINLNPLGNQVNVNEDRRGRLLLKYDPNGILVWSHLFEPAIWVENLAVNANNKIVIHGTYIGTADFDLKQASEHLETSNGKELFVAVYTYDLELIWVRSFKSWKSNPSRFANEEDQPGEVVFGLNDEVLFGMYIGNDTFDFDPNPQFEDIWAPNLCQACGSRRVKRFVIALSPEGNLMWKKPFWWSAYCGGSNVARLAVDNSNNLIHAQVSCKENRFDPEWRIIKMKVTTGQEIFEVAFDADESANLDHFRDVDIDHENNVYVLGQCRSSVYPDPANPNHSVYAQWNNIYSYEDFLPTSWIGKYGPQGDHIWSFAQMRTLPSTWTFMSAPATELEIVGNTMVVSGQTIQPIDIDPSPGTFELETSFSNGSSIFNGNYTQQFAPDFDVYIVRYTTDLEPLGGFVIGGPHEQSNALIQKDQNGYIRMAGHTQGPVVLPIDSLESPLTTISEQSQDVFMHSFYIDSAQHVVDAYDTLLLCPGDTVNYNGQGFYQEGVFELGSTTLLNSFYLANEHLVVVYDSNALVTVLDTVNICNGDSVWFNGTYISEPGSYTEMIEVPNSCDSAFYLHVISDSLEHVINDSVFICQGDSVLINGTYYHNEGTYSHSYTSSASGCDSIVHTKVIVDSLNTASHITINGESLEAEIGAYGYYYWFECETHNMVQNSTQHWFTPPDSGFYYVIIDASGYCMAPSSCLSLINASSNKKSTAIEAYGYPSPANSNYYIQFGSKQSEVRVELFDLQGRQLFNKTYHRVNGVNIDVSYLSEGYYLLRLSNAHHQEVLRFTKSMH